jgi:hypothetical protein
MHDPRRDMPKTEIADPSRKLYRRLRVDPRVNMSKTLSVDPEWHRPYNDNELPNLTQDRNETDEPNDK